MLSSLVCTCVARTCYTFSCNVVQTCSLVFVGYRDAQVAWLGAHPGFHLALQTLSKMPHLSRRFISKDCLPWVCFHSHQLDGVKVVIGSFRSKWKLNQLQVFQECMIDMNIEMWVRLANRSWTLWQVPRPSQICW